MAIIGYARVSSTDQDLDIQIARLKDAGAEEIFAEKKTGTSMAAREQLELALRFARRGDVFVVTRMDRLARSLSDLSKIVDDLNSRQIGFKVLDQSGIDTTSANGVLMLQMLGAFAQFETTLRQERQREGIERAKTKGVYKGRPAKLPKDRVRELHDQGLGPSAIAKELSISRASVYRLLPKAA